jgi:hypothetical protein
VPCLLDDLLARRARTSHHIISHAAIQHARHIPQPVVVVLPQRPRVRGPPLHYTTLPPLHYTALQTPSAATAKKQKPNHADATSGTAQTHNARLVADTDGTLLIPNRAANISTYTSPLLTFGPEPRTLVVPSSPPSSNSSSPSSADPQYYTISGPSGRGIYKLSLTSTPKPVPGLFGAINRWEQWEVVSDSGLLFLRDAELVGRGFWVAVPGADARGEEDVWSVWWLDPSGASVDVLKGAVMVNIEVVEEKGEGE